MNTVTQGTRSHRRRTLIFFNIILTCVASSLLSTALTTALPPIMADLDVSATTGQWLTSGYSLAMAIMMPLTAFLITRFPTRRLYLTSLGVFILGCGVCGFAPSFWVLLLGRILQAAGGGVLTSMAQVVLLTIYPVEQRGTVMGWYGLSVGAAPVVAPTLAGVLVDLVSWRVIFYLSGGIMVLSLLFALNVFDDVLDTDKKSFDVGSFLLSALAFGGITLGVGSVTTKGISHPSVFGPLVLGLLAGAVFARRQLGQARPFLELRILRERNYALSVVFSMVMYFVMMGSSILMPLYVQSVMGQSATVSGLVTLPGSLTMAIVSPFAGKLFDKAGIRALLLAGSAALVLSNLGMFLVTMDTPLRLASVLNIVRCVAIGCLLMPLVTWGLSGVPVELTAHGTALLNALRTVAGAVGTAVFVGIMTLVSAQSTPIHGMNIAFLIMAVISAGMLLGAILLARTKKEDDPAAARVRK